MQLSRFVYSTLLVGAVGASAVSAAPVVLNGGFESPSLNAGAFQEGTGPSNWTNTATGTSGAGIVSNGSAYTNSPAPEGTQALLLKSTGGAQQTLSGFDTGTSYVLNFYAEGRPGASDPPASTPLGPNPIQVLVDGTPLTFTGSTTITPAIGSYTLYSSDPFSVTSSTPVLLFNGAGPGDVSSFVDNVTVTPEPASVGLLGIASIGFLARRRRGSN